MKRILYVEDNQDTADAVKIILTNQGFEIVLAANGKAALEAAKQKFDLVLLDIMLPDMSGWDIFEKLRPGATSTKFAFLSAIPVSSERMEELRKSGVSDYITKPFTKSDLVSRINKMLEPVIN